MLSKSHKKDNPGIAKRALRSIISITILTALVLGIALLVRTLSSFDAKKFAKLSGPLFSKIGVSEKRVGDVAGAFAKRFSQTDVLPGGNSLIDGSGPAANGNSDSEKILLEGSSVKREETPKLLFKLAIMADSENDSASLKTALQKAKENGVEAVFFLGDYTNWGDKESLQEAKNVMDASEITYYSLPGDHDLAKSVQSGDSSGISNFKDIFGNDFYSVNIKGFRFVALNNSANYSTINADLVDWFEKELPDADFVLLSQPLYHPILNKVMGIVDGKQVVEVRKQALVLLEAIRKSRVKAIIAGDQHVSSENKDPIRDSLQHLVVGAIVTNDNEIRNPETPRFTLLKVYEDGSYETEDIVL